MYVYLKIERTAEEVERNKWGKFATCTIIKYVDDSNAMEVKVGTVGEKFLCISQRTMVLQLNILKQDTKAWIRKITAIKLIRFSTDHNLRYFLILPN